VCVTARELLTCTYTTTTLFGALSPLYYITSLNLSWACQSFLFKCYICGYIRECSILAVGRSAPFTTQIHRISHTYAAFFPLWAPFFPFLPHWLDFVSSLFASEAFGLFSCDYDDGSAIFCWAARWHWKCGRRAANNAPFPANPQSEPEEF